MSSWRRSYSTRNDGYSGYWPRSLTVAERRAKADQETAKLAKKGESLSPVRIHGRTIASTFWGKAWCTNLERYSDYANRLPRGRSYLSSGQVLDLRIDKGKVLARVMGTRLYTVAVSIDPVTQAHWKGVVQSCAGQVGSMIELLQGKLSQSVMETVTQPTTGLFPKPAEIHLQCSCPDWASMCKHVAATLYGVGARLDESPELLFVLRGVDPGELVVDSGAARALTEQAKAKALGADTDELASLFGIDMASAAVEPPASAEQPDQDSVVAPESVEPKSGVRRRKAVAAKAKTAPAQAARPSKPTPGKKARTAKAPQAARARSSAKSAKAASEQRTLVAQSELDARDIGAPTVEYWVSEGLLLPGTKKGTWLASAECMRRIERCAPNRTIRRRARAGAVR